MYMYSCMLLIKGDVHGYMHFNCNTPFYDTFLCVKWSTAQIVSMCIKLYSLPFYVQYF